MTFEVVAFESARGDLGIAASAEHYVRSTCRTRDALRVQIRFWSPLAHAIIPSKIAWRGERCARQHVPTRLVENVLKNEGSRGVGCARNAKLPTSVEQSN
jgi:hypothetical protein